MGQNMKYKDKCHSSYGHKNDKAKHSLMLFNCGDLICHIIIKFKKTCMTFHKL